MVRYDAGSMVVVANTGGGTIPVGSRHALGGARMSRRSSGGRARRRASTTMGRRAGRSASITSRWGFAGQFTELMAPRSRTPSRAREQNGSPASRERWTAWRRSRIIDGRGVQATSHQPRNLTLLAAASRVMPRRASRPRSSWWPQGGDAHRPDCREPVLAEPARQHSPADRHGFVPFITLAIGPMRNHTLPTP